MSDNQKKIKVKFPLISYDMIEEAAELSGCSVKAFAANAILQAAMHTVQGIDGFTFDDLDNIELTRDEAKALLGLVDAMDVEDAKEDVEDAKCECDKCPCDKAVCENCEGHKCECDQGECTCATEEAKTECCCGCCEQPKAEAESETVSETPATEAPVAPTHAVKPVRKGKKRARK